MLIIISMLCLLFIIILFLNKFFAFTQFVFGNYKHASIDGITRNHRNIIIILNFTDQQVFRIGLTDIVENTPMGTKERRVI